MKVIIRLDFFMPGMDAIENIVIRRDWQISF